MDAAAVVAAAAQSSEITQTFYSALLLRPRPIFSSGCLPFSERERLSATTAHVNPPARALHSLTGSLASDSHTSGRRERGREERRMERKLAGRVGQEG